MEPSKSIFVLLLLFHYHIARMCNLNEDQQCSYVNGYMSPITKVSITMFNTDIVYRLKLLWIYTLAKNTYDSIII